MLKEKNKWWKGVRWQYVISFQCSDGMECILCDAFRHVLRLVLVCFNIQIHYVNLRFSLLYNLFNILIMTWLQKQKKKKKIIWEEDEGDGKVVCTQQLKRKMNGWMMRNWNESEKPNETNHRHSIVWLLLCCCVVAAFLSIDIILFF